MRHLIVVTVALIAASPVAAQEQRLPTQEEMAAAMALAAPGAEHQRLAALAGTWDQEVVIATGPTTSTTVRAVAENRMVLGGRFLVSESKTLEPFMGQVIESMSIYGFDRRGETYTLLGLDSFGTYYVEAEGKTAVDGRTIVMPGVEVDPKTKREERYEMILRFVDGDTYVTAIIFKLPGGEEAKAVEITHRRRRS